MGDASEAVWLELLQTYLPRRYQTESAHVVDSEGDFSEQIDVVVFDRQYSPFIFHYQGGMIIPAESVYAVFECKQTINAENVAYAKKKVASVRRLTRTSQPIPHAGGTYAARALPPILGGILAFESDWKPALGQPLIEALDAESADGRLDCGCIAVHGYFTPGPVNNGYEIHQSTKSATGFLFSLMSQLQALATVPMIDIQAYARWLENGEVGVPACPQDPGVA